MEQIIKNSVAKAISYAEYNLLFKQLVTEGRTTGEPTSEKIDYTKLNFSRSKRLDKTIKLLEAQKQCFQDINEKQIWLVITEPWCGDAAQSLPFFNHIAESSENVELKIVLRDENPALMDVFLTNGSRSIPKLIVLDKNLQPIAHWGPRSNATAKVVDDYIQVRGAVDDQLKTELQIWYNKNKGEAILSELQALTLCEENSINV
ncbi:thiol-disulfide isomerase/thioredoxin [Gillisia sp. Hel_I_86]|uniref:thioredoxin family protein n=1 Tax=Gillisia sp. Hel_I_86 TaxID=1249981 RepID=UPI001199B7C2|nr:thioredoxin family protein [Gillisia sp. Hel_I_86]TVZ27537.1 thiol-disulfide isomerase/thioredoxin [Gillisia sp. Hel_I_86]